jgi:hypothetical protein
MPSPVFNMYNVQYQNNVGVPSREAGKRENSTDIFQSIRHFVHIYRAKMARAQDGEINQKSGAVASVIIRVQITSHPAETTTQPARRFCYGGTHKYPNLSWLVQTGWRKQALLPPPKPAVSTIDDRVGCKSKRTKDINSQGFRRLATTSEPELQPTNHSLHPKRPWQ